MYERHLMKLQIGQRDQHGVAVFLEFLQHLSPPRESARPLCCPGSSAVQSNRPVQAVAAHLPFSISNKIRGEEDEVKMLENSSVNASSF